VVKAYPGGKTPPRPSERLQAAYDDAMCVNAATDN